MASNRISLLIALDAADDGLKRALGSAQKSLGGLADSAKNAGDKASAGISQIKAGMSAFGEQINSAKTQLLAFLTINWAVGKAQEIIQVADAWNAMNARLKLATAGAREYTVAQNELFGIAQRIGVPIAETATLYGKLQQATRMLGLAQQDALLVTESISQALRISGASATESQSALLQFGQALASGVLRGEEFNSVVENSPRLAKALADGLNVPIGRLRKMAEEGRLTADVVIQALMSQKSVLAAEYSALPATVGQAFVRLSNVFAQWIGKVDDATGFTQKLSAALTFLANHLDSVMAILKLVMEAGIAVLAYRLLPALITAWQTAGAAAVTAANATAAAWATVNLSVGTALSTIGKLKTAFLLLGSFFAGWEIGTWLSEKFSVVRTAGIFMVEVLVRAIEQLRYRWEVFAAIFSSDTIAAATQRHQARLQEMNGIFRQMYEEANKSSNAARNAAESMAGSAEEISKRMEAVRQGTQEAIGRGSEAVHAALQKLGTRLSALDQQLNQSRQTANESLARMAEGYKGLTEQVSRDTQTQTEAIRVRYQSEASEQSLAALKETERIQQSTTLLSQSLTQQGEMRRVATLETLRLLDEESIARRAAASQQGNTETERKNNSQRLENELLATKRQTLDQALAEYRSHIDALNQEANRHLAEITRIESEKSRLSMSTEERIREIRRQSLTEFEADEDRKKQIAEFQAQSRQALQAGDLENARNFAQKAMDLAAQVASTESAEAKRAADAKIQAAQEASRVQTLEAQAREAASRQEFDRSDALLREAENLRASLAQKSRDADQESLRGKSELNQAIERIRESETLLQQTLDAEGAAHKRAANDATNARDAIQRTIAETETQITQLTERLQQGLKVSIGADTQQLSAALDTIDGLIAQKNHLLQIQLDLQTAERQLDDYAQLLKAGKTLPVDIDLSQAQTALQNLAEHASTHAQVELKVSTDKALAAVNNLGGMLSALNQIKTESVHAIASNAAPVKQEIAALDGGHTTSVHTIHVRRVEDNAVGGIVGLRRFASGGSVFSPLAGGSVPGTGDQDTVPRLLQSGAFVIRKSAVRKYGSTALGALGNRAKKFMLGGFVGHGPENRDVTEALKMIDLGMQGMDEYTRYLQFNGGPFVSVSMRSDTLSNYGTQAGNDRGELDKFRYQSQLTGNERQILDRIKQTWHQAMAQALVAGHDLERDLIDYMSNLEATPRLYAEGGASSDSVPAMLTPGEYVINRETVNRFGAGFFEAINRMKLPSGILSTPVPGFAAGGLVPPTPISATDTLTGTRSIRVELASGNNRVSGQFDARDESKILALLEAARMRSS
jgi:tape measure domain-containing protein